MSVLSKHFDASLDQRSPLKSDYVRRKSVDENGVEHITFEPVDYDKLQKSLGNVDDWSLMSLVKAGVNPDFPIHTSSPTRLEVENQINSVAAEAEVLFKEPAEVVIHEPEV